MAAEVSLRFAVRGTAEVISAFKNVVGQAQQAGQAVAKAGEHAAERFGKLTGTLGLVGTAFAAIGVTSFVGGLTLAIREAVEAEASMGRLRVAIQNTGTSFDDVRAGLDDYLRTMQRTTGFSDNELASSLSRATQITHNYEASLQLLRVSSEFARGTQMDLESATTLVGRAMAGGGDILKRYGVFVKEGATNVEILNAIMKTFGGSAEAHMNTAAGASARFRNALQQLLQTVGTQLLPTFARFLNFLADLVVAIGKLGPALVPFLAVGQLVLALLMDIAAPIGALLKDVPLLGVVFGALAIAMSPALSAMALLAAKITLVVGLSAILLAAFGRTGLWDRLVIIWDKAAEAAAGLRTGIQSAIESFRTGATATSGMTGAAGDLTNSLRNLLNSLRVAGAGTKKTVEELETDVVGLYDALTNLGGALQDSWQRTMQIAEAAQAAADAEQEFRDWINETIGPIVEATNAMDRLGGELEDFWQRTIRIAATSAEAAGRVIGTAATDAHKAWLKMTEELRGPLTAFGEEGVQVSEQIAQSSVEAAIVYLNSWRTALEASGQLTEAAAARINAALISLFERFNPLAEAARQQWEAFTLNMQQRFGEYADFVNQGLRGIASAFGQFFHNVLSGQQTLGQALGNLWKGIVDSILGQIARLAASWLFWTVLRFLFPGAAWIPAVFSGFLKFQRGGEFIATQPTLMSVGEAGAERVSVTPLAGGNRGAGGGVTIQVFGNVMGDEVQLLRWARAELLPILRREAARGLV